MKTSPRENAMEIVRQLQGAGFSAFWVGGCVRDFLLGREPQDFDIATDAKPDQVEKLFPKTISVGKKFGVMVVVAGEHHFQIATFRAESDYEDGRRPAKIHFADAKADASRRDFTVNGLFYDPISGKTHDWFGGEKDLRAKIIRTIGEPEERFAEDHLRLLRAVRFAAQLVFEIEPETFSAIKSLAPKIKIISAERVRDELLKLFRPPHAARGLDLLRESGLLEHILPELAATISCEQSPDFHPEGSVFNHIRLMLKQLPLAAPESLPWAAILHDIGKPPTAQTDLATGKIHFYTHEKIGAEMSQKILNRLRFPKKQIDEIVVCVRNHMQFKDVKQMRTATLRRLLLRETFPLELELHKLDCLGSHGNLELYDFLLEQAEELKRKPRIRPPLLTGNDLIELGMKPGPKMGSLLHEIREKQLAEELKTRRSAKAWARKRIK
ncbi:MAG TPA: CCA tRNA nucleotidyltransferase [Verrucomicrobiae bacterium]|nr:CCA tRNA nucleotidyltransferase [Verrucomicrobiae bacterium]